MKSALTWHQSARSLPVCIEPPRPPHRAHRPPPQATAIRADDCWGGANRLLDPYFPIVLNEVEREPVGVEFRQRQGL